MHLQRCKGETACGAPGLADLEEWDRLGKLIKSVSIKSGKALKRGTGFGGQAAARRADYKSWLRRLTMTHLAASSDDRGCEELGSSANG